MLQKISLLALCFLFLFTPALLSTQHLSAETTENTPKNWSGPMLKLRGILHELLPDLVSNKNLETADGLKRLQNNTKKMLTLAHQLDQSHSKGDQAPATDPIMTHLMSSFKEQLEIANELINDGRSPYAIRKLREVTSYCIACHTRGNQGLEFLDDSIDKHRENFTPMELADYWAATRRFNLALEAYEKILSDPETIKNNRLQWGISLQRALQISVRIRKSPDLTLVVVQKALNVPGIGSETQDYIRSWEKAVKEWKKENVQVSYNPESLMKEARRLLNMAKKYNRFPEGNRADIYFMRASSVIHDLLQMDSSPQIKAEAYDIAGQSYEGINDAGIWDMHEGYYECCIRTLPKSERAERCYDRLRETIEVSFTNNSGTQVPSEIMDRLKALKKLATRS